MTVFRILAGFVVSIFGGDIVIRPIVVFSWNWLSHHPDTEQDSRVPSIHANRSGALTMPLGMIERFIYTGAFLGGAWQVIGAWLVLKVAAKWKNPKDFRGADNVWLIGNALSLIFGFIGAWIVIGHLPTFPTK